MRKIEDYIRLAEEAVEGIRLPERPAGLYAPIAYGLSNGGKRLRPALLLAACEAAGGDCREAMNQAAAVEMFHNFTLLHDDVMDNADLRRGKPTVCRKWDNNTAILSGDTMLTLATRLLTSGTAPEKAVRLLGIFNQAAIGVYEGQQYDMEFESRNDVSIEEYIDMIRLKTSVLLGCSARLGAEMGGADRKQGDALYGFAMNLGISFQLQDDWLDVYGDPDVFGKAIGGDILNNKKTYLLIKALELAKGSDREELLGWLEKQDAEPDRKIKAVTAIYDRLGIGEICREAIESYNAEALRHLDQSGLDSDAVAFFKDFDNMVMNRNK